MKRSHIEAYNICQDYITQINSSSSEAFLVTYYCPNKPDFFMGLECFSKRPRIKSNLLGRMDVGDNKITIDIGSKNTFKEFIQFSFRSTNYEVFEAKLSRILK